MAADLSREGVSEAGRQGLTHEAARSDGVEDGSQVRVSVVEADRGARALRAHWGLGIDGLVAHVRKPEGRPVPVVVVNSSTCAERQRFTIGHEPKAAELLNVTVAKLNQRMEEPPE